MKTVKRKLFWLGLLLAWAFPLKADIGSVDDYDRREIEQRILPIGRVHVEGKSADTPKTAGKSVNKATSKAPGQAIYEAHGVVCHDAGVAGAPKFRNTGDWTSRLANNKLEGLVAHAIKGLNAMPAMGTCNECTPEEIKQAVHYMLPK